MKHIARLLLFFLLLPLTITAQAPVQADRGGLQSLSDADQQRFEQIKAKHDRGEPLTPEERQFAQRILQLRNQQQATERFAEYAKTHPPRESVGLVPLTELGKGTYQGEAGGLYRGGENTPPPKHLEAGEALARSIVPLDPQGRKAPDGRIVLLSIGMSNTTQEFQTFRELAADDKDLNPNLALVDGAQGGQTATITANPNSNFWSVVDQRLSAAGVTKWQVQVVWLKQANAQPTQPFPVEAQRLKQDLVATLHNLHDRFPNLKIAYLSSRIYAGYAVTPLNPEPHAYESAFAVKWVIAGQMEGQPELNFDRAKGPARSPWLAWGPYLWADGTKARKDALVWLREDFGPDGTHPSLSGRKKVAKLLLQFFKTDPTARPWFLNQHPAG